MALSATVSTGATAINTFAPYYNGACSIGGGSSTVAVTNYYGMYIGPLTVGANGSVTNKYQIYQADTTGTNVFSAYSTFANSLAVTGTLSATGTGQVGTTLGVGAATPSASGAGITFPATQSASTDANTLDDYEEGTWPPNLGGTTTYTTQVGTYRKIGSQVICTFDITINALGTGLNDRILSLPFPAANQISTAISYYSTLPSSIVNLYFGTGSGTIAFAYGSTAAASTSSPIVCWQNGTTIRGTIIYSV
jgi:hypothetical protein